MSDRKVNMESKRAIPRETKQLGDLIVAAYDEAAQDNDDPSEASRVAADVVMHLLQHARSTSEAPRLLLPPTGHQT